MTYVDIERAAAVTGLPEWKIRDLVVRHEIPHTRAGRRLRFSPAQLARWMDGGEYERITMLATKGRLVDAKTIATYLGLTERGVRGLVARRAMPFSKLAHSLRFDIVQIDRWIAANTVMPDEW